MARDIESLVLQMSADLRRFEKSMGSMRATADKRLTEVERRAAQADRNLSRAMAKAGSNMTSALQNSLAGVSGAIAAAFSVDAVVGLADSYTQMQNRLKVTGLEAGALKQQFDALNKVADASRSPIEAVVAVYSRLRLATEGMAFTNEQVTRTTEILSKALKASGATAGETSAALLQFGQAIGSGTLQGDELRSIRENAPAVARAIADEFGVTVGALKKLGEEGKLTSERVMKAVLASGEAIDATFAKTEATVGDALTNLQNKLTGYIGLTDDSTSATDRMRQAINALAENLDTIALVVGAVATIMGGRFVLAMTAGSGAMIANGVAAVRLAGFQTAMTASLTGQTTATVIATGATRAFTAAIAANPIGAVLVAVTALAAGLFYLSSRYSDTAQAARQLNTVTEAADTAIADYAAAVAKAQAATGAERVALLQTAEALREVTAARIADARVAAQQQIDEAVSARRRADESLGALQARRETGSDRQFSNASIVQDQAASARAQADIGSAVRARQQADEAIAALRRLETAAEAAANPAAPPRPAPAAADDDKKKKSSGPTPEELARQRQLLDLQAEIERLRAQGESLSAAGRVDEARALRIQADAKQDQIDLLNLTKQYEDAGFANAEAKARVQVTALAASREEARTREAAREQAEGEARALDIIRGFALDMLGVQEQLALTDRDALAVRRQILAIRQAERRAALEAAAADADATAAERAAATAALANLPALERGENRQLEGSREGARQAQDIVRDLNPYANAVEQARDAYAEIDRMRIEDGLREEDAARAKAQIDADLRETRLSGVRGMLGQIETLQNSSNKKLAALGKAAAIAQATIDGVLAVQNVWARIPAPFNIPAAAIMAGIAAANVASIAGMADGGLVTGRGGPRDDKELRRLSPGEFVVNAKSTAQNRELLEQINGNGRVPGLANGGMVGRINSAASRVTAPTSSRAGQVINFAPIVDARGADRGAARQIKAELDDLARNLPNIINGVRDRRARFKMGSRRP